MSGSKPFRLAVYAVLFDARNRCLVLRRSAANRSCVGCWEWPGGKVDSGEDFETALRRELREETGLEAEFNGLAGASEFELDHYHVVLVALIGRAIGGELRLSPEHDAADWVLLPDLEQQRMPKQMKPILQSLLTRRESHVLRQ